MLHQRLLISAVYLGLSVHEASAVILILQHKVPLEKILSLTLTTFCRSVHQEERMLDAVAGMRRIWQKV